MNFVHPEPTSGCWLWVGKINENGYGFFTFQESQRVRYVGGAHRASYILHKLDGIRPNKKDFICHKCDIKICVNPEHLYLGNQQENMKDFSRSGKHRLKAKTHCVRGHEYTEENTLKVVNKKKPWVTSRFCRKCSVIRTYKSRESKKVINDN